MVSRLIVLPVLCLAISACSSCPTLPTVVSDPIWISRQDVLTRGTKQQILDHNEEWQRSVSEK